MSSSRIIKAGETGQEIDFFSFDTNFKKCQMPLVRPEKKQEDFVPLELFDRSELGSKAEFITNGSVSANSPPPEEEPPPPPGRYITDEELARIESERFQSGLQEGKNLAERGLVNVFKGMRSAAEELQNLRTKVLRDSESDLLDLLFAVAGKVITREVRQDSGIVLKLIKAAISGLNERDELTIRLHPDDYAVLTSSMQPELQHLLENLTFQLKSDHAIEIGSCLVETERGTIDAGFTAQLEELYRRILEERASAPSGAVEIDQ